MVTKKKALEYTYLGSSKGFKVNKPTQPIYTVTSVQAHSYTGKKSIRPCCWGWLPSLKQAQAAVKANSGDMAECSYYSHLVIEKVHAGIPALIFSDPNYQKWFEWVVDPKDPDRFHGNWIKCARPPWSEHIAGWSF